MKQFNTLLKLPLLLIFFLAINCASQESLNENTKQKTWELISAGALVVDVRTPDEFKAGHLDSAINIPYNDIINRSNELGNDKSKNIVVYCRSGRRASVAQTNLKSLGFTNVYNGQAYLELLKAKNKFLIQNKVPIKKVHYNK